MSTEAAPAPVYSHKNPFPARHTVNVKLTGAASEKDTRHHEISLAGSVLRYVAGDIQNMSGGRIDSAILRQLLIASAMIIIMLVRPRGLWPSPEHGKAAPAPLAKPAK